MTTTTPVQSRRLFAAGNPLLDIVVQATPELLAKYSLKPNDATLAGPEHQSLYDEIAAYPDAAYVAGGAAQNTARCAQVMLPAGSTVYTGAVARDTYGERLADAAAKDGVKTMYQIVDASSSGTCAVLVSQGGAARSLVANPAAASSFSCPALLAAETWAVARASQIIYMTGFFLFSSPSAVKALADLAWEAAAPRILAFNVAAAFICMKSHSHAGEFDHALACADIIFCNDDEIRALANERPELFEDVKDKSDAAALAAALARAGRHFKMDSAAKAAASKNHRTVIVTQGERNVLVAVAKCRREGENGAAVPDVKSHEFEVPLLEANQVVDTNGAGDAFAGGYLAHLLHGHELSVCIDAGMWLARAIIMRSGVIMPPRNEVPARLLIE